MLKEYLTFEDTRNKKNHKLYEALVRRIVPGCTQVVIGHHICFTEEGSEDLNEIPSIDTLLFDLDLMTRAFGNAAKAVMLTLVTKPADERDKLLAVFLETYDREGNEIAVVQEVGVATATGE